MCVPVAPAASFLSGSFDMHPARVMSTAEKEGKEGEEGKKKKKKSFFSSPSSSSSRLTLGMGGNMPIRELYHAKRRGKLRPL